MYASFFGMRELPFNNTPDPRYFYSTPDHEEALASLIYAISESRGFVLLTGEVGAGKTLVTRLMLRHFNDRIVFAGINHTRISSTDLLRCICDEFHIECAPHDTGADLLRRLQDSLVGRFAEGKPVVLMLDEAQALSRDAFEQVRMIGNVEADDAKLIQIVIVGQPELRERFESDDMRQLRQRIFRSFHLRCLTPEQTQGYVRHRLSVGGAQYPERIFDEDAINIIYAYSQGLPRLINTVCDNAMLSAYAADQLAIDGPFVQRVIEQMTSVAQGGPQFASPRVPAIDSAAPDRLLLPRSGREHTGGTRHDTLRAPARADHSDLRRTVEQAAGELTDQAQRVRRQVLNELNETTDRLRGEIAASCKDARILQARQALENAVERSCVIETRLKSEMIETTDALQSLVTRAAGLQERLRAVVSDAEQRIERAVDRASRMQSSVADVLTRLDTAQQRCAPLIGQLHRQSEAARQAAGEAQAATAEARAAVELTQQAHAALDDATQRLAQQTARSGQLTITLRQAFDRMQQHSVLLNERPASRTTSTPRRDGAAGTRTRTHHDATARSVTAADDAPAGALRTRSRALVDWLEVNRGAISNVRNALAAARISAADGPRIARSQLAQHVSSLTDLIAQARQVGITER